MELHQKYMEMDMDNVMDMDVNMDDRQNSEFQFILADFKS